MKDFQAATVEYLASLSEAKLQALIIEPLLRLQGFTHVRATGGPNDKGKDLVAIRTEFGKTKLYGIQIKKLKFSGKHNRPNALTHVLTQLRQLFGEEVLDSTVGEKRKVDRAIFITPFAISRDAFESAVGQLKDLERREVSIIDGPLLADLVLKHMPRLVGNASRLLQYRMRLTSACNQVKESAAFGLSRPLDLDSIYVAVSLQAADGSVEEIAGAPLELRKGVVVLATDMEIKQIREHCSKWGVQSPVIVQAKASAEVARRMGKERDDIESQKKETTESIARLVATAACDQHKARLVAQLEVLKATRVLRLDLDTLLRAIQERAKEVQAGLKTIDSPEWSNKRCTRFVLSWLETVHNLQSLRNTPVVARNWPTFVKSGANPSGTQRQSFAPASILKIDLPVFVTGAPGAGKTTLLRRLSQTMARESAGQLPLLIYLVQFQTLLECDIIDAAKRELNSQGLVITRRALEASFNEGKYRVFLDGLDEAGASADLVLDNVLEFVRRYPRSPVVVTTREYLHQKIWRGALQVQVTPFSDDQLSQFLQKWFTSEPSKLARLRQWLTKNPRMCEAARTPIIAALLCSLTHAEAEMPTTEVELYEQRFELLLGKWEKAKGIQPMPKDLRRNYWHFLMNLAGHLHRSGVRSAPKNSALDVAAKYRSANHHPTPHAFLDDCVRRGLVEEESLGGISFGHLTYQEFLVACWLEHNNNTRLIWDKLNDPWWEKAINMYAAKKGDISSLIEEGIQYGQMTIIASKRLDNLALLAPLTPAALLTESKVSAYSAPSTRS